MARFDDGGPVDDLLTSEQVVACLLADAQLRRLALTCVLPAVRCGNEWRFRRSDLDQWIRRQPLAAPAARPNDADGRRG